MDHHSDLVFIPQNFTLLHKQYVAGQKLVNIAVFNSWTGAGEGYKIAERKIMLALGC